MESAPSPPKHIVTTSLCSPLHFPNMFPPPFLSLPDHGFPPHPSGFVYDRNPPLCRASSGPSRVHSFPVPSEVQSPHTPLFPSFHFFWFRPSLPAPIKQSRKWLVISVVYHLRRLLFPFFLLPLAPFPSRASSFIHQCYVPVKIRCANVGPTQVFSRRKPSLFAFLFLIDAFFPLLPTRIEIRLFPKHCLSPTPPKPFG